MTHAGTRPLVCPVLIGRDEQLAALRRLLEQARLGHGAVALISGDAGVGKSRLAAEVRALALRRGCVALEGSSFEPDTGSPYAPLLDMLRLHFARRPATAGDDAALVDELLLLLPGVLSPPRATVQLRPLGPEAHKRRLFAALSSFLSRLAAHQPLLLIVEDVHWSDDGSLEFLHFLARRAADMPLLMLLTYRSEEPSPSLRRLLAQFDRERLAFELPLASLDREQVGTMLRRTLSLDRPVRPEFLDAICPLTEGNPFFIEEVLQSLVAAGDLYYRDGRWDRKPIGELRIPRSVRDAVQQRVTKLGARSRAVLQVASVIGRAFDYALLAELAKLSEVRLLGAVKELIMAQLIEELSADRLQFRHALIREAIYAELLTRERRTLHRRVAETIRRQHAAAPDVVASDLACHYAEAGEWTAAYEFALRAGRQARLMYAPRAAIEQLTRALLAARNLGSAVPVELYLQRGQALETLGDFDAALGDMKTALALGRSMGDGRGELGALLNLGYLWASRDYNRTGEYYRLALDLSRRLEDALLVAASLNRLGNWYVNVEQPHEGMRYHNEALDCYTGAGELRGIAETHDLLGQASAQASDAFAVELHYREAIAGFRALNDRAGLSSSLAMLAFLGCACFESVVAVPPIDRRTLESSAEEALAIAHEIGWRAGEAYARFTLSMFACHAGQYGRALEHAHQGLALAEAIEHHQWSIALGCAFAWIFIDLLDAGQALGFMEQASALAEQIGSRLWIRQAAAIHAQARAATGDVDAALALLRRVDVASEPVQTSPQRICRYALVETLLAASAPERALEQIRTLQDGTPNAQPGDFAALPRLSMLRGRALGALGRWQEAEGTFLAAREGARRRGAWPLLWRAESGLVSVYRSLGRLEDAALASERAASIVAELAATVPSPELRGRFVERAAQLSDTRAATRRRPKQMPGSLTARELEVARLISRGLPNRAIADELVISERTVEAHVSNILGKLGFTSRARIVAWVLELKGE